MNEPTSPITGMLLALHSGGASGDVERARELCAPTLPKVGLFDLFPRAQWAARSNEGRR